MTCQCTFTNCKRHRSGGVLLLEEPARVWEEGTGVISVLSPQLCYEAKTALRKINRELKIKTKHNPLGKVAIHDDSS